MCVCVCFCAGVRPQACDPRYSVYTPPVHTSSLLCLISLVLLKRRITRDAAEQVASVAWVIRRHIIQRVRGSVLHQDRGICQKVWVLWKAQLNGAV